MNRSTQHAFNPEELMAYLDGELAPSRAATLAGHLEHCDECQALAGQLRQLSERLLDFEIEPPSARIDEAIGAALQASDHRTKTFHGSLDQARPRTWRRVIASPYTWVAACILIAVFVVTVRLQNQRVQEEVTGLASPARGTAAYFNSTRPKGAASAAVAAAKQSDSIEAPAPAGPMIARTASLTITAANYDEASAAIDRLAASQGGYIQKLESEDGAGASRELSATLRVPAAQLSSFLVELRKLGHVEQETRANDEVTDQYVDLQARLKSARAPEQRMLDLLATRTGKLEDVLDAERELARIRAEIESMEGQRIVLSHRVDYATVDVQLREEYRESLNSRSSSTGTRIWNATVDGLGNLASGAVGVLLLLLAYGPSILFWIAILVVPGWLVWRRFNIGSKLGL